MGFISLLLILTHTNVKGKILRLIPKTNILKVLYLAIVLLGWQYFNQNCFLFILTLVSLTFFLAISFAESKLLSRHSLATIIFRHDSIFFSWLHTRWFVLLISIFKALILAIIILISLLQWSDSIVAIMFVDIAVLLVIYQISKYYLGKHTKEEVNQIIARRTSIVINIVIVVPILIVVMLYSAPPDYLDISLKQTLMNAQLVSKTVSCDIVSLLLSYDALRDGLGWWLMTKASLAISNTTILLLGWTLFLLIHTFYVWAFSKLILSTTIPWNSIFFTFKEGLNNSDRWAEPLAENEENISSSRWYQLDSFSIGFFSIIIVFLALTLTFSTTDLEMESLPVDENNSKLIEILNSVDALADKEQNKNIEAINRFIEIRVNNTFQSVYDNIPRYAQAQYTWYRDYISIYQVAKKELSDSWQIWKYFVNTQIWKDDVQYPTLSNTKSYAQKSSEELQSVLFGNGAFDKKIETLNYDTNRYMQQLLSQSQGSLHNSIANEQIDALHASDIAHIQAVNKEIEETFLVAKNELNSVAKTYKIGEAGVTLILTKTILTKLLAKSGVKVVAKSGSFLAGGATGLTVCAPSGPWAIACGAVAGTLTWVGVDFAVSKADEALTREAFEAKLRQEIDRNKEAFTNRMKQTYTQGINKVFNDIDSEIKRPMDYLLKNDANQTL